jgi:hypothetical protein
LSGVIIEWINVEDRLPEKNGRYLVTADTDDGLHVTEMRFEQNDQGEIWFYKGEPTYCHTFYIDPIYWMPLPEPPPVKSVSQS